jgi:hypothetical protein
MPNIQQFEAKGTITPNEAGVQAYEMMGRRVGSAYRELGQDVSSTMKEMGDTYINHQTQEDIVHGGAAIATLFGNIQSQWNAFASDPANVSDHAKVDAFRQTISQQAEDFSSHFRTQEGRVWASQRMNELQQHFYEKTAADASTMAGIAAVQAAQSQVNQSAASAHDDFTSLDLQLGLLHNTTAATAATIGDPEKGVRYSAEINERGSASIVLGAFQGLTSRNPEAALAQIDSDPRAKQYLTEQQRAELTERAHAQIRANAYDQRAQTEAQKKAQEDAAEAQEKRLYAAGIGLGQNGTWAPPKGFNSALNQLAMQPGAKLSALREFGNMANTFVEDQASGRLVTSDPKTFEGLLGSTALPAGAPGALTRADIYQAAARRQLSQHDASLLTSALEDAEKDPTQQHLNKSLGEFFTSVKPTIGKTDIMGSFTDGYAAQRFYQFQTDVTQAVTAAKMAGKSNAEIEGTLLNPRDPAFLGLRMGQYSLTTQQGQALAMQRLHSGTTLIAPPNEPAAPGGGGTAAPAPGSPAAEQAFKALTPDQQAWIKAHNK